MDTVVRGDNGGEYEVAPVIETWTEVRSRECSTARRGRDARHDHRRNGSGQSGAAISARVHADGKAEWAELEVKTNLALIVDGSGPKEEREIKNAAAWSV